MSILRHGVAREVRTGLSLLTPEKHRRIFLLAAFLLLLAGPAWAGIWPSRCLEDSLPGAHATTCTSMPSCDIPELLAASRAWAKDSFMVDPDAKTLPMTTMIIPSIYDPCGMYETAYCLRRRAERAEAQEQRERETYLKYRRWKAAIEACGK